MMMGHLWLVAFGALAALPAAAYLRLNGRPLAERALDRVIEFQKRLKGGYYRRIDPNAKCPSCGAKDGEIAFNPLLQKVVHTCHVDQAMWAENPRIRAEAWDFVGRDAKFADGKKSDLMEIMDRANAATLRKPGEKAN